MPTYNRLVDKTMGKKYTEANKKLIAQKVFSMMEQGVPCGKSCFSAGIAKSTFLGWTKQSDGLGVQYARANEAMIHSIADEILEISDTDPVTVVDAAGVSRYDSAAVQHQRLRVDSRKWLLSKMMPKVYGDKAVQEHVGAGGGPITVAALDLKNLSDEELDNMEYLMQKSGNVDGQV
tara:strand:+ start:284 stop:814 length:531 start_codon:yes stop_codon:yes gene_type:complete